MRRLLVAVTQQRGQVADAVGVGRGRQSGHIQERRQRIVMGTQQVALRMRCHVAGPAHDQGHTNASLVHRSLESAQRSHALEELGIDLLLQVRRAVVGSQEHDRPVVQVQFL